MIKIVTIYGALGLAYYAICWIAHWISSALECDDENCGQCNERHSDDYLDDVLGVGK